MKKYLIRFMPFWESKDVGIISKICLTYTTIILGLLGGIIALLYGSSVLLQVLPYISQIFDSSQTSLVIQLIFHALFYIILGLIFIYHYTYTRKGFKLKNSNYIKKSYLAFGMAWYMYEYTRYGLSLITLLAGALVIAVFTIPLNKAKKSFNLQNSSIDI